MALVSCPETRPSWYTGAYGPFSHWSRANSMIRMQKTHSERGIRWSQITLMAVATAMGATSLSTWSTK